MSQKKRGAVSAAFKLGPPKAHDRQPHETPSQYPVMLAGVECMAEGHSFHRCNNVILLCYSWAYDKFEQAINRAHRLNSLWDVNVYPIICDGSIDRKLEALIQEKGDAAELVLDGTLQAEQTTEVNLAELLNIAQKEFNSGSHAVTVDEATLEKAWPQLRLKLGRAFQNWKAEGRMMNDEVKPALVPALEVEGSSSVSEPDDAFDAMPLWRQRMTK